MTMTRIDTTFKLTSDGGVPTVVGGEWSHPALAVADHLLGGGCDLDRLREALEEADIRLLVSLRRIERPIPEESETIEEPRA